VSNKPPRCDSCGKRIRPNHHLLVLSDFQTGQIIGRYHIACQAAIASYVAPGVVLNATIVHPDRCWVGEALADCDAGRRRGVA
jgi:hypothetical protein